MRLVWHNDVVRLNLAGEGCYLLGEWSGRGEIFCPSRDKGRKLKNVDLTDPSVTVLRDEERGQVFQKWPEV